jgi:uncharacterized protein (DUF433 family)
MEAMFENLTTTEAAVAAGVSVSQINRVFDEDILPHHLYSQTESRSVRSDACLLIAFYFETADVLTKPARLHAMKDALTECQTWSQWERCVVEDSGVSVRFYGYWKSVSERLTRLHEARSMVVEDPEILSGTPIIRGTRIPVYDVAALVEQGTPIAELLEMYPRLNEARIELASVYAKAVPEKGRPKRRDLPKGTLISVSKGRLKDA